MKFDGIIANITDIKLVNSKKDDIYKYLKREWKIVSYDFNNSNYLIQRTYDLPLYAINILKEIKKYLEKKIDIYYLSTMLVDYWEEDFHELEIKHELLDNIELTKKELISFNLTSNSINKKEEVDELKELQYTIIKNRFNEYLYDNV